MLIKEQLIRRAIVIYLCHSILTMKSRYLTLPHNTGKFSWHFITVLTGFHSTFVFLWMYVIIVFYMQDFRQSILCYFDHVQNYPQIEGNLKIASSLLR